MICKKTGCPLKTRQELLEKWSKFTSMWHRNVQYTYIKKAPYFAIRVFFKTTSVSPSLFRGLRTTYCLTSSSLARLKSLRILLALLGPRRRGTVVSVRPGISFSPADDKISAVKHLFFPIAYRCCSMSCGKDDAMRERCCFNHPLSQDVVTSGKQLHSYSGTHCPPLMTTGESKRVYGRAPNNDGKKIIGL